MSKVSIFENIIAICKYYMDSTTKISDSAALIIAKFFTRPDIHQTNLLKDYMIWANDMILSNINQPLKQYYVSGVLLSLV